MRTCWTVSAAIASALLIAGCVSPPPRYASERGATMQQFMQDRYQCAQEARGQGSEAYVDRYGGASRSSVTVNRSLFSSCLAARGYRLDPNGPLIVPPDAIVRTSD